MNAWFFGCSFTAGYGLNFEEWYQKGNANYKGEYSDIKDEMWDYPHLKKFKSYKNQYSDAVWSKLISNHYNLTHNNFAESGSGNDRIIHKVISKLTEINSGDYVFIGTSEPSRILLPTGLEDPELMSTLIFLNRMENKIEEGGISFSMYNDNQKKIIIDFLLEIIHQNPEAYENYYKKRFIDLQKYFESKNIKCIIWEWSLWFDYETLKKWSNKNIKDGHWSPSGHYKFYNYMKNNIDNGNHYITSSNQHIISPFKKKKII